MDNTYTGGCQCGAVRFSGLSLKNNSHVCHCRMCQKAAGNFFMALVGIPLDEFKWTRGTPKSFASSAKVQRGFCSECGTPLFFKHQDSQHISMCMGAFDQPQRIPLEYQLGMEGRLPQVDQLADLKNYGSTEDNDPEATAVIKTSNQQHPDYDT